MTADVCVYVQAKHEMFVVDAAKQNASLTDKNMENSF